MPEYSEIENERELEQAILELQRELKAIFKETHFVAGHGTSDKEVAEAILQKGLRSKWADISSTAVGLQNTRDSMKTILQWPHGRCKFVVTIEVPKTAGSSFGRESRDEHLWKKRTQTTPKPNGSLGRCRQSILAVM